MVLAVIVMFNALRQTAVIWLTVPLAVVGVAFGLLVFQAPFEFMAILGVLSLTGMLIKNAIVLVDQIDVEIRDGKPRFRPCRTLRRAAHGRSSWVRRPPCWGWRRCSSIPSSAAWR